MTHAVFNTLLRFRIEKIRATLSSKGKEYASDADRLHNFKADVGGLEENETPAQVLWGYLRKHLQSVYDIVSSTRTPDAAVIDEKVGDAINYLILLEAVLLEGTD